MDNLFVIQSLKLLALVLFLTQLTCIPAGSHATIDGLMAIEPSIAELQPVETSEYQDLFFFEGNTEGRRSLLAPAPYQKCASCNCCTGGDPSTNTCTKMSCCYGIKCNLPGKPPGACAFVPMTCNCNSCDL